MLAARALTLFLGTGTLIPSLLAKYHQAGQGLLAPTTSLSVCPLGLGKGSRAPIFQLVSNPAYLCLSPALFTCRSSPPIPSPSKKHVSTKLYPGMIREQEIGVTWVCKREPLLCRLTSSSVKWG